MRNEKTNFTHQDILDYTRQTISYPPGKKHPEILQGLFDVLSEFFQITPLNETVHHLNLIFHNSSYTNFPEEHPDDEEKALEANPANMDKSVPELKAEIKRLKTNLYDTGIFYWKTSMYTELIIDLHQTYIELCESGMESTAGKSLRESFLKHVGK